MTSQEALQRGEAICEQYGWFWEAAQARVDAGETAEGRSCWFVSAGERRVEWTEEETDATGLVLVFDRQSGEFVGVKTLRGIVQPRAARRGS